MKAVAKALEEIVADTVPKLKAISPEKAAARPSAKQWSPSEIVGHLIDSASNNHQRFVRILHSAKLVFPPYAQEDWVLLQDYRAADWTILIELWRSFNLHLAHLIRQIPSDRLARRCTIGDCEPVTLGFLIEDYVVHMTMHVKQLGL